MVDNITNSGIVVVYIYKWYSSGIYVNIYF